MKPTLIHHINPHEYLLIHHINPHESGMSLLENPQENHHHPIGDSETRVVFSLSLHAPQVSKLTLGLKRWRGHTTVATKDLCKWVIIHGYNMVILGYNIWYNPFYPYR